MAHQQLIVPVVVHDLPPPITYKQICQALLKLQQAQHTLIQHLMVSIQEQADAVRALQTRLTQLLRHVATLYSSPHPLTLTAYAPHDIHVAPPPRIPAPLPIHLHEFAVPGDQLARVATTARTAVEQLQRPPAPLDPCRVQPLASTTLEALLPRVTRYATSSVHIENHHFKHRETDAVHVSSGSLSGMASVGVQQLDVLPSFFGAPTSTAQPGQHLPVLSSMDTRPRVVQSLESEDDAGM